MNRYMSVILGFVLVFVISTQELSSQQTKFEQRSKSKRVDHLFKEWNKKDSPGAAVIVIKDGSIVHKNGYGKSNLEHSAPITSSTVFDAASLAKQFTGMAIAILTNQGKLSLDDDIHKYLPEVPDFGRKITIRNLVYHTSGLRDWVELLAIAGWRMEDVITYEQIVKMVKRQRELNFNPGENYLYSNTNYILLATIVSRVTGQTFRGWTYDNIFKPIGMVSTSFQDNYESLVTNRAYSYYLAGDVYRNAWSSLSAYGSSSLFTTSEDLAKWLLNFEEGRVGGKAVIELMNKPGKLNNGRQVNYAFGQGLGKYKDLAIIEHSGAWLGYKSDIIRFPNEKFAIAILSNSDSMNPERLARQIADIYLNLNPTQTSVQPQFGRNGNHYGGYEGRYVFDEGLVLIIANENGHLMGTLVGRGKAELFPQSDTKFSLRAVNAQIEFKRDGTDFAKELIFSQGGQTDLAKRIVPPTGDKLAGYVGDFYSDELGMSYAVRVENSQLVLHSIRRDEIPLLFDLRDQFSGSRQGVQIVEFLRDKENHVIGFRISGERVKNLRFRKQ